MSIHCQCESSLCDHDNHSCERKPDPRFHMKYLGETCSQCASNMCSSGGASYINLTKPNTWKPDGSVELA